MEAKNRIENKIIIGKPLPEIVRHHIKKYVTGTDYGYVAHLNKISQGSIDRLFRNVDPTNVTDNTYPSIIDLAEMAYTRLKEEKIDAEVSKKLLKKLLK